MSEQTSIWRETPARIRVALVSFVIPIVIAAIIGVLTDAPTDHYAANFALIWLAVGGVGLLAAVATAPSMR